jgi:hypothetical protein
VSVPENGRDKRAIADTRPVSPLSFLKNPMILMALFSMVLIFGMPYLMDNSELHEV